MQGQYGLTAVSFFVFFFSEVRGAAAVKSCPLAVVQAGAGDGASGDQKAIKLGLVMLNGTKKLLKKKKSTYTGEKKTWGRVWEDVKARAVSCES